MTRKPAPPLVVTICMADGTPISSPEAQLRIARALVTLVQRPRPQVLPTAAD